jgi:plastocyanin
MSHLLLSAAIAASLAPAAAPETVALRGFAFSPETLRVQRGDAVRWTWRDGAIRHNVVFRDGRRSASKSSGTFTRRFRRTGRFAYRCTLHTGMTGRVVVR